MSRSMVNLQRRSQSIIAYTQQMEEPKTQAIDLMQDYKDAYRRLVRNRSKSPTFGHQRTESSCNQVAVSPSNQVILTQTSKHVYENQREMFKDIRNRCGLGGDRAKGLLDENTNIKNDLIQGLFGSQQERQLQAKKRCLESQVADRLKLNKNLQEGT